MPRVIRGAVLAAVLSFAGAAEAMLINGDFETGDLTGWTTIASSPTTNEQAVPARVEAVEQGFLTAPEGSSR